MWSYIAGGFKIKVIGIKSSGLIIKGGLKMEGCKIEGLLYTFVLNREVSFGERKHHNCIQCTCCNDV